MGRDVISMDMARLTDFTVHSNINELGIRPGGYDDMIQDIYSTGDITIVDTDDNCSHVPYTLIK